MAVGNSRKHAFNHPFVKVIIACITIASIYFVFIKAVPKIFLSPDSYGDYYWYRAPWLFIHNLLGMVALLSGPLQLIPSVRKKSWRLHRNLGKIYIISVILASITSVYLSYTSAITVTYALGLFVGSVVWLVSAIIGWVHIRNKKVLLHKQWMIRNYIVTFFFIIIFGFYDLFRAMGVADLITLASVLPWISLIVPLIITEILIRRKIIR